jgi:hypothetical protein
MVLIFNKSTNHTKMKKTVNLLITLTIAGFCVQAQNFVNQGADIRISSGTSLVIAGNFRNALDGSVTNSGNIRVTGNWINDAVSGNLLQGTTGTVFFTGAAVQNIAGTTKTWFSNLNLQNNAALGVETSVSASLTLVNKSIGLGNYNLIMEGSALINGASATGYAIAAGTGQLKRQVGNSDTPFPVGTTTAYVPVVLKNSGTLDTYGVNVFADVRQNGLTGATIPQIADCVNMTWNVTENTSGGSNLSVTPYWSAGIEGASFNRATCGVGHYTGGAWNPQAAAAAGGANPYFITRTGITSLSAFAVGDLQSPMAIPLHITLDVTALLEGPYNGATMNPSLNAGGSIPLAQPYNVAPWNYPGTENVGAMPNAIVVDWVLLELRDATSAANATSATTIARQAAFVLNNGAIVGLDGSSDVLFTNSVTNQLFVVVWHRNHLGVMSANPLVNVGGIYSYDFTTAAGQAYGADAHKLLAGGKYGMYGGDGDANKTVNSADKTAVWAPQAGTVGYKSGDFNMNRHVNNPDKNDIWVANNSKTSKVPN